jgi:prepilin signal peptidase PulO-like enzyme (type II secretory pathway)
VCSRTQDTTNILNRLSLCECLALIGMGSFLFQTFAQVWAGLANVVPILILIYADLLRDKLPDVAPGLTIGLGILVTSMVAPRADEPLCQMHPLGNHFLWHILNAVMLAWMIEVYRRHMLAGRRTKR